MTIHQPYEKRQEHPCDFLVEYRFLTTEEGGRSKPPFQGYRSDFWYEHDNHEMEGIFMIHPEFIDENGDVILETNQSVSPKGKAKMWILLDRMRKYHQDRIVVGTKGYFMEGNRKVAICTVIEIVGLMTNPIKDA